MNKLPQGFKQHLANAHQNIMDEMWNNLVQFVPLVTLEKICV